MTGKEGNGDTTEAALRDLIAGIVREELKKAVEDLKPEIRKMVGEETMHCLRMTIGECLAQKKDDIQYNDGNRTDSAKGLSGRIPDAGESLSKIAFDTGESGEDEATDGLYLYAIAGVTENECLGTIGIDGSEVYTIIVGDLTAIVHDCPPLPYHSEDADVVNEWVQEHQAVVDSAIERFGTVLPFGFDTIIKGNASEDAWNVLSSWLTDEHDLMKEKLDRVNGRREYGIQIFYAPSQIGEMPGLETEEIRQLKNEMAGKGPGAVYVYKQKIEKMMKDARGERIKEYSDGFYKRIKQCTAGIITGKMKKSGEDDRVMMMNLSCLADDEQYRRLGEVLEDIDRMKGFSVRFTGPWPPYSFV